MPFLSPPVQQKYGSKEFRFLKDCVTYASTASSWYNSEVAKVGAGKPAHSVAYNYSLRCALVRELTREIDEQVVADAYELLSELNLWKESFLLSLPGWQLCMMTERLFEGGWEGLLAQTASGRGY